MDVILWLHVSFEYLKDTEKGIMLTKGESYCQHKRTTTQNKHI